MQRAEALTELGWLAADQWGLVTAAQARAAGVGGVQLMRLAETGLLEKVAHGVYLLAAAGQPAHLEIKVAWLRLQPEVPAWERQVGDEHSGVVSHASACQLHDLGDIPAPQVEISVPKRRVTTEPAVRLRTAAVAPQEATVVDGLPVTTACRTIVDLLRSRADGGHVGGVIADAERRGMVTAEQLASQVGPFARSYGLPSGTEGSALIERLVAQAGEQLRAHELAEATQRGFNSAVGLIDPSLGTGSLLESALRERLQQLAANANPVQQAMDQLAAANPMRQAMQQLAATTGPLQNMLARNAELARAARIRLPASMLGPAVKKALPATSSLAPTLRGLVAAQNTAVEETLARSAARLLRKNGVAAAAAKATARAKEDPRRKVANASDEPADEGTGEP